MLEEVDPDEVILYESCSAIIYLFSDHCDVSTRYGSSCGHHIAVPCGV